MEDADAEGEPQVRAVENSSSWTINWMGVLPIVLAIVAFVAWRWLDGSDDPAQVGDATAELDPGTSVPTAATSTPITTAPRSTTTTAATTTTPATTTTVASQPRVLINGAIEPCRFGSECLVASFAIEGFDEHPGVFTCIYPNSQREFGFSDDDVEGACFTADLDDTIAIEVAGVRSATISRSDLDGSE